MTSKGAVWIWKPLASAAFVAFAIFQGAPNTAYGRWILAGLALSWIGDVLLIPQNATAFLWGLVSFLLAHVAYGLGFFFRSVDFHWILAASPVLAILLSLIGRWILPHVGRTDAKMRIPVIAYMAAVSIMVVLASGATGASGDVKILLGAAIFYLSDISVARDKFVAPGWINKAWGLPLYYAAQLLLAATVAL